MVGKVLNHFRVEERIGAGGMGEVYRAVDTRLDRQVALKVLPDRVATDAHLLNRLIREARVLASLSHPNIAAIHGLEEAEGVNFLVLELIAGETLTARIARGRLPVDEYLRIGREIAAALESAHDQGIIHRDLKPANVMLTPGGNVKVLDFGLAKELGPSPHGARAVDTPTVTSWSGAGTIVGTAAYMSPEQARGAQLDRRTDIWSFGCVLFEMIAAGRPFTGPTVSDTIAAILQHPPTWDTLPPDCPDRVRHLVRRCLQKDVANRLRDAGDARLEIEEALAAGSGETRSIGAPAGRKTRLLWPVAAAAILAAALGFGGATLFVRGGGAQTRSWSGELLLGGSTHVVAPRVSPDGRLVAFVFVVDGLTQVAVMEPGTGYWSVLTRPDRTRGPVFTLAWSPDSTLIYFDHATSRVMSVPAVGGEERLVLEGAGQPETLPDGSLLVLKADQNAHNRIHRFWPTTGRLEPIGPPFVAIWPANQRPHASRDGKVAVLFGQLVEAGAAAADMGPYAIDLESGQARRLAPGLKFNVPHFPLVPAMAISRDGRSVLIDVTEGDLHRITALPLDGTGPAETLLTLTVPPTAMAVGPDDSLYLDQLNIAADVMRLAVKGDRPPERIAHTTGASPGMGPLELPDGRLLFSSVASGRTRLLIARAGEAATMFVQANEETSGPATQLGPERVAFFVGTPPAVDIAVALTDGRIVQRLTVRLPQVPSSLAASRDGRTLYYADTGSIWALPVAGGVPQKLYRGDGVATVPDGSALIVQTLDGDTSHFVRVPLAGGERKEIALHGELGPAPTAIGGDTVRSDGRIALPLQIGGSWFWRPGLLDLHTGEVSVVPARVNGDVMKMNWGRDGTLLALAWEYRTEIWRFRPAATPQSASGTRR